MPSNEWTAKRLGILIRQAAKGQEWDDMKKNGEEWPDFLARKLVSFSDDCLNGFAENTLIPGLRDVNKELEDSLGKTIGIFYEANKPVKIVLD